jgi:hypothetical protein
MMNYRLFFFIALLGVTNSCCKEKLKDQGFTGKWKWIKTSGGLLYSEQTPASTGNTILLSFNAGNSYSMLTNGSITSHDSYQLKTATCMHDRQIKTIIDFSSSHDMMIEKLNNNELILSDEADDGYMVQYQRQ